MCLLVIGLLAISIDIAEGMTSYIQTNSYPFFLRAYVVLVAGQVPIYTFSVVRALITADNVTEAVKYPLLI